MRVIRTLSAMGIRSVAVFSDADAGARHVAEADVAVAIGPAPARQSYLDIDAVVAAARRTGAQAVHPGYGFLSENAEFAAALQSTGIVFIGPPVAASHTMGDKIAAKAAVSAFGVPVVPGIARPGLTDEELIAAADDVGYPVLVKPSAGGGGKGMRVVERPADLPAALARARRESAAAFGDDTLFLERFVLNPRHIEVQILADDYGNVVHLGERECSLQRRHQKVIEEAPSPLLDADTRARIGAAGMRYRAQRGLHRRRYRRVHRLRGPPRRVLLHGDEHPIAGRAPGHRDGHRLDLVELQVRIASGEKLPITAVRCHHDWARRRGPRLRGGSRAWLSAHRRKCSTSSIRSARAYVSIPGLAPGTVIGSDYDPMLAKIIAHAGDRSAALRALDRALADTAVLGVTTNIEFLRFLLADSDVVAGRLDTGLLDRRTPDFAPAQPGDDELIAAAAYKWLRGWPATGADLWAVPSGWRLGERAPTIIRLHTGDAPTTSTSPARRMPRRWWSKAANRARSQQISTAANWR